MKGRLFSCRNVVMLEHSCLHVAPWTPTRADAFQSWIRPISASPSTPLGFVRLEGAFRTAWFSWLRSVHLDVYETEDASHLMRLIRSWGVLQLWDVYDAEERRVGSIYPPSLVDAEGERRG